MSDLDLAAIKARCAAATPGPAYDGGAALVADARTDVPALVAEVERLRENSPLLARVQPCGCIVCYCEGQERCNGCGAKNCAKHVGNAVAMDPAAVWVKHPLLVEVDRLTKMLADQRCAYKTRAETAEAEVERLRSELAECYRVTGADPDGNDDAMLARKAVAAVKRLREESDTEAEAAEAEIVRLRAIEAEAKTYLANMDYCFTAENLTVEDEGHRDASESRLRSLLAKGGAA